MPRIYQQIGKKKVIYPFLFQMNLLIFQNLYEFLYFFKAYENSDFPKN